MCRLLLHLRRQGLACHWPLLLQCCALPHGLLRCLLLRLLQILVLWRAAALLHTLHQRPRTCRLTGMQLLRQPALLRRAALLWLSALLLPMGRQMWGGWRPGLLL